ncbi:hypothetical protein A8950_3134 [Dongia mobilis]|uniref:UPF0276 protein A8950_3134 n=1 Tax=Dongia mobilis TaxID=578943 RepID=A0A4R6WN65_9PROT|nr:DUF692 domain-containing protein [Dongia mobilis]TDQ80599.1 hypothetical protein A8950_3134 [Dongia mobilis]
MAPRRIPSLSTSAVPASRPTPAGLSPPAGVGLRPPHFRAALAEPGAVDFLEVHPENYLCDGGPQHHFLTALRQDLPLSFHGVGLSLGGADRPDRRHLARLRQLVDRYQPFHFSEHLAWSSHGGTYFNDLLPLPYTQANLARMSAHVAETQDCLGRQILIENPSLYLTFAESEMSEAEFLAELSRRSGCRLLLDINNLYVSAINAGWDSWAMLAEFPQDAVAQIHLAGHDHCRDADGGSLLIDTHGMPVADPVWDLFAAIAPRLAGVPVLIEWDQDLPDWPRLVSEASLARQLAGNALAEARHVAIA